MDDVTPCSIGGHRYGELVNTAGLWVCTECGHVDTMGPDDDWWIEDEQDEVDRCANEEG